MSRAKSYFLRVGFLSRFLWFESCIERFSRMDSKSKEFLLGELIGEQVKIEKSSSKGLQGIEGRITDETRNTFLIETRKGRKRIAKQGNFFAFRLATIDGSLLVCRPEDRTKVLARKLK